MSSHMRERSDQTSDKSQNDIYDHAVQYRDRPRSPQQEGSCLYSVWIFLFSFIFRDVDGYVHLALKKKRDYNCVKTDPFTHFGVNVFFHAPAAFGFEPANHQKASPCMFFIHLRGLLVKKSELKCPEGETMWHYGANLVYDNVM